MAVVTRLDLRDLRILLDATVTTFTGSTVSGALPGGQSFILTGAAFGAPDQTGLPTTGTVSELKINIPIVEGVSAVAGAIAISGMSMPASELRTYIAGNLVDAFLSSALAGNDTLSGYYDWYDALNGYGGDDVVVVRAFFSADEEWRGGAGNDTFVLDDYGIRGGLLDGGAGIDTVTLPYDATSSQLYMAATMNSVERLVFSDSPRTDAAMSYDMAASSGPLVIVGGPGQDNLTIFAFEFDVRDQAIRFSFENWSGQDRLFFSETSLVEGSARSSDLFALAHNAVLSSGDGTGAFFSTYYSFATPFDLATIVLSNETLAISYAVGDAAVRRGGLDYVTTTSIEWVDLTSGAGADSLVGGGGNDVLDGGAGADLLEGGGGFDIVSYATSSAGMTINVDAGVATWGANAVGDVIANFEGVRGGANNDLMITNGAMALYGWSGADQLYGSASADTLDGEHGDDIVIGFGGNDTIALGDGQDYVYGGDGADSATGGSGLDVMLGEAGDDTLNGGNDQDYLFGGDGVDNLSGGGGVDVLIGGAGNDVMTGGDGGDYFYGEDGNDTGGGGAGNDIFVMTAGNDTANGDAGQDYFYMGDGDDVMFGGAGVDVMLGEGGNDTFSGGLGVDYLFLGPTGAGDNDTVIVDKVNTGVQVLYNFEAGGVNDSVRLTGTGWTAFSQVQAAITDFTASGGFCILTLDADTAVWFIGVQPSQFTAADFLFA